MEDFSKIVVQYKIGKTQEKLIKSLGNQVQYSTIVIELQHHKKIFNRSNNELLIKTIEENISHGTFQQFLSSVTHDLAHIPVNESDHTFELIAKIMTMVIKAMEHRIEC